MTRIAVELLSRGEVIARGSIECGAVLPRLIAHDGAFFIEIGLKAASREGKLTYQYVEERPAVFEPEGPVALAFAWGRSHTPPSVSVTGSLVYALSCGCRRVRLADGRDELREPCEQHA